MAARRISLALVAVLALALQASAGTFVQPTGITGTSASGIPWSAVATGTALPVRTSTSGSNGIPGAVVYFNTLTGQLQFDPKGLSVNTLIITYTTGTTNVSGTTAGPFQYLTGTGFAAISPATGTPEIFPATASTTGLAPTTIAARVGMTVGNPLSAFLATTYDPGNGASTDTYWNQPWAFPADLVKTGSTAVMVINNFATIGQNSNANANILGYGLGRAVFQYGANGIVGTQVGAVIPVVPEPSTYALLGAASLAIGGICRRRRKGTSEDIAG